MGVAAVRETPSLTGEFIGETHRVLQCRKIYPSAPEGPNLLVVEGEVTESRVRAKQVAMFPFLTPRQIQHSNVSCPTPGNT